MRRRYPQSPSLRQLYDRLRHRLGPQHWWPAKSAFEMMIGAILTQATSWHNVEAAIARLKQARALSAHTLARLRLPALQRLIRSAGYFRQKALRVRRFSRWYLNTYQADTRRMFQTPTATLRRQLLALNGIGPETADAMLLYAGRQPIMVIDAYTKRIFRRHGVVSQEASYEALQDLVMDRLPEDARVYNEFHALLVAVGKRYCHRQEPDCQQCPLGDFPHDPQVIAHG